MGLIFDPTKCYFMNEKKKDTTSSVVDLRFDWSIMLSTGLVNIISISYFTPPKKLNPDMVVT